MLVVHKALSRKTSPVLLDLFLVSAVANIVSLALPLAMLQIYDRIIPNQNIGTAWFLLSGVFIAILIETFLRSSKAMIIAAICEKWEVQHYAQSLTSIITADYRELDRIGKSRILQLLKSITQIREFKGGQAQSALFDLPFSLIFILLVCYLGGTLVLIPVAFSLISILYTIYSGYHLSNNIVNLEYTERRNNNFIRLMFENIWGIKATGAQNQLQEEYQKRHQAHYNETVKQGKKSANLKEISNLLSLATTVSMVAFGAIAVIDGEISIGALTACTILASKAMAPISSLIATWQKFDVVRKTHRNIDHLRYLRRDLRNGGQEDITELTGNLSISDLSKHNITSPKFLSASAGETILLESARPSDIYKLMLSIAGLDRVAERSGVTIDGHAPGTIPRSTFAKHVRLVCDRSNLWPGSLLDNLTGFDANARQEALALAEAIKLTDVINKLPKGFLTPVSDGIVEELGPSTIQRIALVRALVGSPSLLLFYYADVYLDMYGIQTLTERLSEIQPSTTILLASHSDKVRALASRTITLQRNPSTQKSPATGECR